jgi:hypothetical protein
MNKFFKKEIILPILIVIFTVPLFFSLLRPGFFPMQDDLQAFRVQQMVKCLQDLQIPCRWIPDMGYQYGYPQFNFYPPSVFYLGALLNLVGIQVIDTVKILFILGFVLSALTMFVFLKALAGEWPAFVGAALYSFAPYKAAEVYVRGSLSEFWAFVFFPLIFWSALQLIRSGKIRYLAWLAVSLGLLLTTHNLMSFIFLPIFASWVLAAIFVWKKWRVLPKVILASLLGLGLAAFFTIPVIFEGKFVHLETLTGGYFDFRQHFVNLTQLFISNHFGYGSSYLGSNDDLSLSVGQIHWVLGALALVLGLMNLKRKRQLAILILVLSAWELVVLFLMHQRSTFVWEVFPALKWLQFPWRFMSDSVFLLSLLGALAVYFVSDLNRRWGMVLGIAAIAGVLLLHGNFFQPRDWFNLSDQEKFSGGNWEKQLTISIFDYLPVYAKLPPNKKAPELPEVLDGEAQFLSYKKGSNYQTGSVEVKKKATIRLPLFDFPGMQVKVDQRQVASRHDDCRNQEYCLGLLTFDIKQGKHAVEAKLTDTPVRRISNIITVISILIVGGIFFRSKNEKIV